MGVFISLLSFLYGGCGCGGGGGVLQKIGFCFIENVVKFTLLSIRRAFPVACLKSVFGLFKLAKCEAYPSFKTYTTKNHILRLN